MHYTVQTSLEQDMITMGLMKCIKCGTKAMKKTGKAAGKCGKCGAKVMTRGK